MRTLVSNLYLKLGDVALCLESDDANVLTYWRNLFGSWILDKPLTPDIILRIKFVDKLPPLPNQSPFFINNRQDGQYDELSILEAYTGDDGFVLLHFFEGGLITVPPSQQANGEPLVASGYVTKYAFETGRFEDITLVGIAPLLRAYGCYLLHSSGVSKNGRGILFVGSSGSGKTTTCLNLVLNGWQLISNDVVMLQERDGEILALPMPDKITIRPKTLTLLPQLASYQFGEQILDGIALPDDTMPTHRLIGDNWSPPATIAAICFPQIEEGASNHLEPQLKAVTAARLLEESVDCWDEASLDSHTAILTAASRQAPGYALRLGLDLDTLPPLLETLL